MKTFKWSNIFFIGLLILATSVFSGCFTQNRNDKLKQANDKVWPERLRGINVGRLSENMMQEDVFKRMSDWKVNLVTINYGYDEKLNLREIPEAPTVPDSMMRYKNGLYILDKFIQNAKKYKMFVNITAGGAWGGGDINVATGETTEENEKDELYYLEKLKELHVYLGKKYKDNSTVLAYNYISEPHTPYIVANWSTKVIPDFLEAFRKVDDNTYLIFSAGLWGFPEFGKGNPRISEPVNDPANKIIYSMHGYAPHNYTHQGIGGRPDGLVYPGMLKMFNGSPLIWWDRDELENSIHSALEFSKKYNVKLIDSEFSANRKIPSAYKWFDDRISIYEEYGISWTAFNFGNPNWDGWNLTVADNAPSGRVADGGVETNRLKVIKKYLKRNTEFNE
jgi:hypothetical protein